MGGPGALKNSTLCATLSAGHWFRRNYSNLQKNAKHIFAKPLLGRGVSRNPHICIGGACANPGVIIAATSFLQKRSFWQLPIPGRRAPQERLRSHPGAGQEPPRCFQKLTKHIFAKPLRGGGDPRSPHICIGGACADPGVIIAATSFLQKWSFSQERRKCDLQFFTTTL